MESEYPKRPSYFANKFCRLLMEFDVASDIGPAGCWLLTIIVMAEDRLRYSKPVKKWNANLMRELGDIDKRTLRKLRQKAIDSGWLHYEYEKGSRKHGRYWVTIPIPDDEIPSELAILRGTKNVPRDVPRDVPHSKPIPKPKPKRVSDSKFNPLTVEIPDSLKGEQFETAWVEWLQHRAEIKKPLTETQSTKLLKKFDGWGVNRSIAAINHSIANGWQGIFEPGQKNGKSVEPTIYKDLSASELPE